MSNSQQPVSNSAENAFEADSTINRVSIDSLNVGFDTDGGFVHAVRGVNLDVGQGQIVALVGESGSGKTVTARSILGLVGDTAHSEGIVLVEGSDVLTKSGQDLRKMRGSDVSMIFQEPSSSMNPVFPIWWQMAEGLRAHNPKIKRKEIRERCIRALETVGIPEPEKRIDRYPHEFSGGQKQRIMIAMALELGAKTIVADEPTTALDVTVQAEILQLLRNLRDEYGTSIVIITHNMGVVADLADEVAVMYEGRIIERAPVEELFAHPKEAYTQKLLGAVPHLGEKSLTGTYTAEDFHELDSREVLVEAQGLEITYPGRLGAPAFKAVKGIDLSIHKGEVYGLVGESGSGKTTIGRAMVGLEKVTGGSLNVLGQEMRGVKGKQLRKLRQRVGFIFQDPATSFNPYFTIEQCIAEPLLINRPDISASERRKRVTELLEAVELPAAFAGRYPHELSGGQRQRVSLARGLVLNPELVIADEPTSALDVSVQAVVLELFQSLQQEFGFAALFISHDLAVIDMVSHAVGVLYHGELVESGRGAQVMRDPQQDYTQKLVASLPVPDPVEQKKRRELLTSMRGQAS
ncbi:ABC transporter ATP-binding protein [Corynebacterium ammoniagenes]|uniref:dipeptide ABC transporter ATP-binding protein n=1 Tax=Corynebacterium ammoniagenes TaxID=1697 RepID=UPI001459C2F1|nr:ABC transporter ATP-binding protein [Corynebacterium ammoniagenes]NMF31774.1 ABC transporter ATP-binding protein [Corynebacterium ammoniagenes]